MYAYPLPVCYQENLWTVGVLALDVEGIVNYAILSLVYGTCVHTATSHLPCTVCSVYCVNACRGVGVQSMFRVSMCVVYCNMCWHVHTLALGLRT